MNKNKGIILMETVISIVLLTAAILPVFSGTAFFIAMPEKTRKNHGERILESAVLKGIGEETNIHLETFTESGAFALILPWDGRYECR